MIPTLQHRHAGCQDSRHTGGSGNGSLPSFHGGNALLECLYGRIGETGVDIARLLTAEPCRRLGGTPIDKAGRGKDSVTVFQLSGPVLAGPYREGVH